MAQRTGKHQSISNGTFFLFAFHFIVQTYIPLSFKSYKLFLSSLQWKRWGIWRKKCELLDTYEMPSVARTSVENKRSFKWPNCYWLFNVAVNIFTEVSPVSKLTLDVSNWILEEHVTILTSVGMSWLDVAVQIPSSYEDFAAVLTFVGSVSNCMKADMFCHIAWISKSLLTILALEWFISCVNTHVDFKPVFTSV